MIEAGEGPNPFLRDCRFVRGLKESKRERDREGEEKE